MNEEIEELKKEIIDNLSYKFQTEEMCIHYLKMVKTYNKRAITITKKGFLISLDDLIEIISRELFIPIEEIKKLERKREIVDARRIFYAVGKKYDFTFQKLTDYFGFKSHASVLHALKGHDKLTDEKYGDKIYTNRYNHIINQFKELINEKAAL